MVARPAWPPTNQHIRVGAGDEAWVAVRRGTIMAVQELIGELVLNATPRSNAQRINPRASGAKATCVGWMRPRRWPLHTLPMRLRTGPTTHIPNYFVDLHQSQALRHHLSILIAPLRPFGCAQGKLLREFLAHRVFASLRLRSGQAFA